MGLENLPMRTESECLTKAAEMDAKAEACQGAEAHASYSRLAESWRHAGRQAAWQHAFALCLGEPTS
jgi:hypothetical protein